ncbi:MAG: hypothetical protein IH606_20175 [Burkholderiales bacterium]|nr:hypothetical protein [Burkholderiales bacterium]
MTDYRKIVKVFLASPGDLVDERVATKSVVDELNAMIADEFGYQIELVGWEDTVSVYGRPQTTINLDLKGCELFVGLMWKKWGTPPDVSGFYSSGFEEEYETSVKRRLSEGSPEISLLFKEINPAFLSDPGEDLKKVLAFKERLTAEKSILFENFADIRDFEKRIRRCIWNYVIRLRAQDINDASIKKQAPTTGGEKQQTAETVDSPPETPLSIEGAKFLRELIAKTERSAAEESIAAVEIARFRLLANLLGRQGNDDRSLGVHDANLMFSEGKAFTFGRFELLGLIRTGLRNFSEGNTPLWYWLAAADGFSLQILQAYSVVGGDSERAGAVAAMRLIAEPLPSDNRDEFLDHWFVKESPSTLRVAALGYLGDYGTTLDLAKIRKEFDRGDNQTVGAAADAIIRISLRDSRGKGIDALYELQPTSISDHVQKALFDSGPAMSSETIVGGISHRSSEVRRIAVGLARSRHMLPNEMAERLINDGDVAVRYEALMSLVDAGRPFSDGEAKMVLAGPARSRGLIGSLMTLGSYDPEVDRRFEQFRRQRLHSLSDRELEEAATESSIFDQEEEFVLAERHFSLRGEELRRRVDDQYNARFSREIEKTVEISGSAEAELVKKTRSLESYTRKELTRRGLDIICRQADPSDLERVRATLRSGFVDYSATDIEYLRRFGEWEDIHLIIEAVKRPEAGSHRSILGSALDDSKYRDAARAINTLGRNRLAEVLAMLAPSELLVQLVAGIPDKAFRSLNDAAIMLLLRSEAEQVRKFAALKCVRALSKRRLSKLLAAYMSPNQFRYYNVVHWLDFGISTPRDRASPAAKKLLNK